MKVRILSKSKRNRIKKSIDCIEESICGRNTYRLKDSVDFLVKMEKTEEIFKILRRVIHKRSRRDSGYDSDLENEDQHQHSLCELEYESDFDSAKEAKQCSINKAIKTVIETLSNANIALEPILHSASSAGNTNLVKFLIEKGVDVDIKNNRGATALHLAMANDNFEVVKALIDAKAKIEEKNDENQTPLQLAVSCENEDIVEYLLQVDANPNTSCTFVDRSTDDIGELDNNLYLQAKVLEDTKYTPLQLAAFLGNLDIIKLLITYRADINAVCKSKMYSCLHMAIFGITYCNNKGIIKEGYLEVLNFLLSKSSSLINSRDHEGNTPLHRAVSANHEETIRVLLQHGASALDLRTGYTVFHDAVAKGNLGIVKLLLDNSDEKTELINYVCIEYGCAQCSPLHVAINAYIEFLKEKEDSLESFNIIKYLLSYPTLDINIKDFNGETPLHYAIKYIEDDELALTLINELLAAKNINPFIKDQTNRTPFDYAIDDRANKKFTNLLIQLIAKRKDEGLHINQGDLRRITANSKLNDIYNKILKCMEEIKSMKSTNINNSTVSFHDILVEDENQLAKHLMNGDVVQALESDNYKTKFPIYADQISSKFKKGIERRELLQSGKRFFNSQPDAHNLGLPDIIIEKIFGYLSNEDIRNLIEACPSTSSIATIKVTANKGYKKMENTSIENYNAKKYVVPAIALCAVNVVFIEMYINQHLLESFISDTQYLGLMIVTNIVACVCCVIISKSIGKSIEQKYKNKVSSLFEEVENNDEISPKLQEINLVTLPSQMGKCLIGG